MFIITITMIIISTRTITTAIKNISILISNAAREQDVIRPATCEGGGEARRSRWMKHSVINKEEENKEEEKDKEEENLGTSKFEAALKDLEALGRGQGTRYFLLMIA